MSVIAAEGSVPFLAALTGALVGGVLSWAFHYAELRRLRRFELLRLAPALIEVARKFQPGLKRIPGPEGAKAFDKHRAYLLDCCYEMVMETRPVVALAPRCHRRKLEHEIESACDTLLNLSMRADEDEGLSAYLSWLRSVLTHNPPRRLARELRTIRRKACEDWDLAFEPSEPRPTGTTLPSYIPANRFTRVAGDIRSYDWD